MRRHTPSRSESVKIVIYGHPSQLELNLLPPCSYRLPRPDRPHHTQLPICSCQNFSVRCSRSRQYRHTSSPRRASGNN